MRGCGSRSGASGGVPRAPLTVRRRPARSRSGSRFSSLAVPSGGGAGERRAVPDGAGQGGLPGRVLRVAAAGAGAVRRVAVGGGPGVGAGLPALAPDRNADALPGVGGSGGVRGGAPGARRTRAVAAGDRLGVVPRGRPGAPAGVLGGGVRRTAQAAEARSGRRGDTPVRRAGAAGLRRRRPPLRAGLHPRRPAPARRDRHTPAPAVRRGDQAGAPPRSRPGAGGPVPVRTGPAAREGPGDSANVAVAAELGRWPHFGTPGNLR